MPDAAPTQAAPKRLAPPVGASGGSPLAVPPAWLPLSWLAAAVIGLIGLGVMLAVAGGSVVETPQAPSAAATVHVGMLAFLSTAVLGAAHQFGPVVAGRRLRSVAIGLVTLILWVPASWLLPFAFATRRSALLEAAGVMAFTAVCLAAWNLSGPLLRRGRGTPVLGLRLAVGYLVITAAFGATYAFDLHHGWFLLLPRRVLAHAHIGLIGWIGLAYVAVAEKLWPMFLLAHRPSTAAGDWAVRLVAGGVPVLAVGLLVPSPIFAWIGGLVVVAGIGSHLLSLAGVIHHRRRRMELLHAFVLTSAVMVVFAVLSGLVAAAFDLSPTIRTRAIQTEIFALTLWLGIAVIGHLHKIVPFISWSRLRASGHTKAPDGKPLLFAHLVNAPAARATYACVLVAALTGVIGMAGGHVIAVRIAGVAIALAGGLALANLTSGPLRIIALDNRRVAATAETADTTTTTPTPTPVGATPATRSST